MKELFFAIKSLLCLQEQKTEHSYEDQIDAVKAAYNNVQMWHMMDEAEERAEKLAEHLEETAPKTPEERKEDLVEEALGTGSGMAVFFYFNQIFSMLTLICLL